MSDKTAAELVSDFVKTKKKLENSDNPVSEYASILSKDIQNIENEMKEWHNEMNQKINKT